MENNKNSSSWLPFSNSKTTSETARRSNNKNKRNRTTSITLANKEIIAIDIMHRVIYHSIWRHGCYYRTKLIGFGCTFSAATNELQVGWWQSVENWWHLKKHSENLQNWRFYHMPSKPLNLFCVCPLLSSLALALWEKKKSTRKEMPKQWPNGLMIHLEKRRKQKIV